MDTNDPPAPYFDQAIKLRQSGYRTKVNALPDEARAYIEELLKADKTDTFIADDVNKRYDLKNTSSLGEVSYKAIASYRKLWRKRQLESAESLRAIAHFDSDFIVNFKKDVQEANVIARLCEMFTSQYESAKRYTEQESKLPLPLQAAENTRKTCFTMGIALAHLLIESGLMPKTDEANKNADVNGFVTVPEGFVEAVASLQREISSQEQYRNRISSV